jgi:hypothetical protein
MNTCIFVLPTVLKFNEEGMLDVPTCLKIPGENTVRMHWVTNASPHSQAIVTAYTRFNYQPWWREDNSVQLLHQCHDRGFAMNGACFLAGRPTGTDQYCYIGLFQPWPLEWCLQVYTYIALNYQWTMHAIYNCIIIYAHVTNQTNGGRHTEV